MTAKTWTVHEQDELMFVDNSPLARKVESFGIRQLF